MDASSSVWPPASDVLAKISPIWKMPSSASSDARPK